MSMLLHNRIKEVCALCKRQCSRIKEKHPFLHLWSWSKSGKQWNYYMSIWGRAMEEMEEGIRNDYYPRT